MGDDLEESGAQQGVVIPQQRRKGSRIPHRSKPSDGLGGVPCSLDVGVTSVDTVTGCEQQESMNTNIEIVETPGHLSGVSVGTNR
eukprot:1159547-Pelagomonas_calceolata.AAC.18